MLTVQDEYNSSTRSLEEYRFVIKLMSSNDISNKMKAEIAQQVIILQINTTTIDNGEAGPAWVSIHMGQLK